MVLMKVIEYGHQQIRCGKCRSLLQFDICDVEYNKDANNHFITCPVCKKEIIVPELQIYRLTPRDAMRDGDDT